MSKDELRRYMAYWKKKADFYKALYEKSEREKAELCKEVTDITKRIEDFMEEDDDDR